MQNTARRLKIVVSADGLGIGSGAGAPLLTEAVRVTGLGAGLSTGLARWRRPRAVHDPGKVIADLAVAVALGGDCLADIAVVRAEPGLLARWHPTRWYPGWWRGWPGCPCCAAGDPLGAVGGPAAGLGAGRGCRARCGRRADPGRHRCHHRDRVLR